MESKEEEEKGEAEGGGGGEGEADGEEEGEGEAEDEEDADDEEAEGPYTCLSEERASVCRCATPDVVAASVAGSSEPREYGDGKGDTNPSTSEGADVEKG